jgi:hypothetical protein
MQLFPMYRIWVYHYTFPNAADRQKPSECTTTPSNVYEYFMFSLSSDSRTSACRRRVEEQQLPIQQSAMNVKLRQVVANCNILDFPFD